jgi:hypothetical protein
MPAICGRAACRPARRNDGRRRDILAPIAQRQQVDLAWLTRKNRSSRTASPSPPASGHGSSPRRRARPRARRFEPTRTISRSPAPSGAWPAWAAACRRSRRGRRSRRRPLEDALTSVCALVNAPLTCPTAPTPKCLGEPAQLIGSHGRPGDRSSCESPGRSVPCRAGFAVDPTVSSSSRASHAVQHAPHGPARRDDPSKTSKPA